MRLPWQQCLYQTELRQAVGSGAWEWALPATRFLLGTQWGHHCPSPPSGPEPRPSWPHLTCLCSPPRGRGLAHSGVWDSFVKHVCAGTRTHMLEGPDSPLQAMSAMPAGVRRDPGSQGTQRPPCSWTSDPLLWDGPASPKAPITTFLGSSTFAFMAPSSANIKNYIL